MNRPGNEITLLDIYESIEGPLNADDCLLETRICGGKSCIFKGLLHDVNRQFKDYLKNTTLSKIKNVMGSDDGHA